MDFDFIREKVRFQGIEILFYLLELLFINFIFVRVVQEVFSRREDFGRQENF